MKLNKITKYRSVWMAFAIIMIILFHSKMIMPNSVLDFIKKTGYGGVDIFIFASGLGCYYSLSKNSDINAFLKKRFSRLMPTFWCFLPFYFFYKYLNGGISVGAIIGNLLCIHPFTLKNDSFNWYIGCIWLFYFLAPYLYFHTKKIKNTYNAFIYLIFLLLFTIPFFECNEFIIMITRLPIFFLGMYCAKQSKKENYTLSKTTIILSIIIMIIGIIILRYIYIHYPEYLWSYGLHWYPFIFIVPGLCLCISLLCILIDNKKVGTYIIKVLNIIGENTFELYLTHIFIFSIVKDKISNRQLINSNLLWLKYFVIVILASILLKYITKIILFICKKTINYINTFHKQKN